MTAPPGDPIRSEELTEWRRALGATETRRQILDIESMRRFAAAVGATLDVERCQPPLAHWAYFHEALDRQRLGPDGHARRDSGLLPSERLPRRMFAATRVQFCEPLTLEREAELTLTLASIEHRVNAGGDLVFVDVDRQLRQHGIVCVVERQTLVYRTAAPVMPAPAPITAVAPAIHARDGEELWLPTRVDLFRFSAATFNSHRIHYDAGYARDQEGYPDLVVQGPLTAVKLLAYAARRRDPRLALGSFAIRARAPLFVDRPVRFAPGAEPGEFLAIRCDGTVAMTGRA